MIVVDASVVVDLVLDIQPLAGTIARRLQDETPFVAAPHLLDAEVTEVLRRHVRARKISTAFARQALEHLLSAPIARHAHAGLLPRVFELWGNASAYDAIYLALAESLGAPLLTRDRALARVPGSVAKVEVIG